MKKKVLILSASTGGGHNRAARALTEELQALNIDSRIVDSLKAVHKTVDALISKGYETSALYTPLAYGRIYRLHDSNLMRKGLDINPVITYMMKKLKMLISMEKPDLVIGTHPFPVMAVSNLKARGSLRLPLFSIITDFGVHHAHIADHIDRYIVGDEYVQSILESLGVPEHRISSCGIPIEKSFLEPVDPAILKHNLGLKDKFTVLLMGGSFGAGNILDVLKQLLSIPEDIQIILVCGRNRSLHQKIEGFLTGRPHSKTVALLGFTDKMNYLMSMSDCIVTKPGGLTVTECLLKELPMIVPFYIPGQEKDNLDFLLNSGLAVRPTYNAGLETLLKNFYDFPDKLERIRSNMRLFKKEHSARRIAAMIKQQIEG
ncbi:MAG: glycosyltransferase [Peptostreptococcaceae bacterium]|nr:glycosyltransferase [Peptostreptococcaceae bacterium]